MILVSLDYMFEVLKCTLNFTPLVFALAVAAHNLIEKDEDPLDGTAMREELKKVSFQGLTGLIQFSETGDRSLGLFPN